MDWNTITIRQLSDGWEQGLSVAELSRRLKCSKNAVVGKVHRLKLDARPSPIRRPGLNQPPPIRKAPAVTLPKMVSEVVAYILEPEPDHPPALLLPPIAPPPTVFSRGPVRTCCWPIGEPGTKAFRFCDEPPLSFRPYCGEHAKLAYIRRVA